MGFSYQTLKTREARSAFRAEYYPEAFRSALSLTHSRSEAEELVDALFNRMNTRYQIVPLPVNVNLQILAQLNLLYARGNYGSSPDTSADEESADAAPHSFAAEPARPDSTRRSQRETALYTNLTDENDYSAYTPNEIVSPARIRPVIKMNMPSSKPPAAEPISPPLAASAPLTSASASSGIPVAPAKTNYTAPVPVAPVLATPMQTTPATPMQAVPVAPVQAKPMPAAPTQTVPADYVQQSTTAFPQGSPMVQPLPYVWKPGTPYAQPVYMPTAPVVVMPEYLSAYQGMAAPAEASPSPAVQAAQADPPAKKAVRKESYNPRLTELWTPAKEAAAAAASFGSEAPESVMAAADSPADEEIIDIPENDDSDLDDESSKRSVPLTIFNTFLFIGVIFSLIFLLMQLKVLPKLF